MATPELIELLAQLDFLIQLQGPTLRSLTDSDREEQMHKIINELADRLGNQYTVDQIRDRFFESIRQAYTYPESIFSLLFHHGSSVIWNLDQETENLVEERLDVLTLGNSQAALQTPRNLRSRSVLPTRTTAPNRDHRNSYTTAPPSASSNPRSRGRNLRKDVSVKKKLSLKAKRSVKSVSRSRTTQSANTVPSMEIYETPFHSSSISNSATDPATPSPLRCLEPIRWPTLASHISGKDYDKAIIPTSYEPTNSPCLPAISTEVYEDMISELAHYKRRYEEAEQECTNLKKEMRQMDNFCTLTAGIPERMLRELQLKTRQISKLKERLDGQIDLEPYLSIGHAHGEAPTTQKLLSYFNDMKGQLASILVTNGTHKPSIACFYGQSADLGALLRSIFDASVQYNVEERLNNSTDFTLRELIQALTGAAIHRWVFESAYRPISMTNTPLLQKYRDHIATLCGLEGLCNLDTAAHQSMIEEKDFKDATIPRIASGLTTRLLNALQPLFDKESRHKTTKMLTTQLDCILRLALQVRSLSLVGNEEYESIWPSSGSLVDNEIEAEHSVMANVPNLVRLPLFPGLRAYRKEKEMVGYHRFGNGEVTSRTPKYIIKALVHI